MVSEHASDLFPVMLARSRSWRGAGARPVGVLGARRGFRAALLLAPGQHRDAISIFGPFAPANECGLESARIATTLYRPEGAASLAPLVETRETVPVAHSTDPVARPELWRGC